MPLIHALKNSKGSAAEMIRDAIINGGKKDMQEIMRVIESTNAISYTEDSANKQAQIARKQIETLPSNQYRDALLELTDFVNTRNN